MDALAILLSLLFFGPPLYYVSLVASGCRGKSHVPVWAPSVCLVAWLAQIPAMAVFGLGCAGGGCAGAGSVFLGLLIMVAFNVAPLWWLLASFGRQAEPADRDAYAARLAGQASGFPSDFDPFAEAGAFTQAKSPSVEKNNSK